MNAIRSLLGGTAGSPVVHLALLNMPTRQISQLGIYIMSDFVKTQWGWNVRYKRPATRDEAFGSGMDVCMCALCSTDCHYSAYYCGRLKSEGYVTMLERYYRERRAQSQAV
jgi:hypothetical protein